MLTLINLVRSYARKLLTSRGTGITQIPNRQQVDILANNILADFRRHKISGNVLKTEQDVKNMHNYIDSLDEQKLEKTFKELSKKKTPIVKDPFQGWDPKIVKSPHAGGIEGVKQRMDKIKGLSDELAKKQRETEMMFPGAEAPSPKRIKQGFSTQMKLNSNTENQALLKTFMKRENAEFNSLTREQKKEVFNMFDAHMKPKPDFASGGIARVGMAIGGFTKAQVLIQMMKNTLKGSKDPYVKKTFPNFIKELQKNPKLALDENIWKQFTTGLPKNQRLVVHSDDSVDFFTQSEFGPHNIEKTLDFQKKHNLSRDQANKILQMEPEDRVLEMKRLETIKNRTLLDSPDPNFPKSYWHTRKDGTKVKMTGDENLDYDWKETPEGWVKVPGSEGAHYRFGEKHKKFIEDSVQKRKLEQFDVTGRKKNASGGIAGQLHLNRPGYKKGKKVDLSKRKFMKTAGAGLALLSTLPFVGKFFKAAKPLSKMPAAEVITKGAGGIPDYAWDLIKVVKAKGTKDITEGLYKKSPPVHKWNYKDVEVVDDGLGNTSVRKEIGETKSWNDPVADDVIIEDIVDREIGFEIRKGETVTSKKGKPVQTPDEYTENTAIMQGDPEGGVDVSEVLENISEADHLELKRIADESLIKKAEGGRASYTKGGLAHVLGV